MSIKKMINSGLSCAVSSGIWFSRADSRFAPSQWETTLLCNDVSHWLGASTARIRPGWHLRDMLLFFLLPFFLLFFFWGKVVTFFPVSLSSSRLLPFFLLLFFLPKTVTFFPVTFFPVTFFPSTVAYTYIVVIRIKYRRIQILMWVNVWI